MRRESELTLVRKQKPEDWAEMRSHSTVLRNVLHFQELEMILRKECFITTQKAPWDNVAGN